MTRPAVRTWVLVAAELAAFWPVWHWVAVSTRHASDERVELIALAVAAALVAFDPRAEPGARPARVPFTAVLLVGAYAAFGARLPMLANAVLAVTALALTLSSLRMGRRHFAALWGLALLALPIVPLLQFHVGYPLRAFAAALSVPALRTCGFDVAREGACLRWDGAPGGSELVSVDAPCSGVRMLWSGLFLALSLAALFRLDDARTLLACGVATAAVLLANALRTAALFCAEASRAALPEWAQEWLHSGAGLAVQAAAAVIVYLVVQRLGRPACAPSLS
jgi:exosortase/archaeosortase family protein